MIEYNVPNDVFQKFYDFLVTIPKIHIKNEKKTRIFIEAVHYLSRTGCQVRLLPKE
jgi:hypothetical protein